MKLKFYGCSGWITPTDEHSCFSIYTKTTKLLFDAGSPKILTLENVDLDAIILSHIHLDHIKNLYNLLAFMNKQGRTRHLVIYAPIDLKGKISEEIIPNADAFRHFSYEFVTEPPKNIGDVSLEFFLSVQNTKPVVKVFSMKIKHESNIISFVTDVSLSDDLLKFCEGSNIIICDASSIDDNNCGHLSPDSVKKLISHVSPKKVVLTHFDELSPDDFVRRINVSDALCASSSFELELLN